MIIFKTNAFLYYNFEFHRMIDMHSKYDNMHKNDMVYALISINIHIILCINWILLSTQSQYNWISPFMLFTKRKREQMRELYTRFAWTT